MSRFDGKKGENVYITPIECIQELGGWESFDLDPAHIPRKDQKYYTAKNSYSLDEGKNGLIEPWFGEIFINPPYCRMNGTSISDWAKKIAKHRSGIMLINATIENKAWQDYVWPNVDAIFSIRGRISFLNVDYENILDKKGNKTGNQQPSIYCAYGKTSVKRLEALPELRGKLLYPNRKTHRYIGI